MSVKRQRRGDAAPQAAPYNNHKRAKLGVWPAANKLDWNLAHVLAHPLGSNASDKLLEIRGFIGKQHKQPGVTLIPKAAVRLLAKLDVCGRWCRFAHALAC
jgi:hypothetical protein